MKIKILPCFPLCLLWWGLIAGCQTNAQKELTPAFYHWRSEFNLSATEKQALQALKVGKLYVHFFDVDWDEAESRPIALASVAGMLNSVENQAIIPTVFITNRCMEKCTDDKVEELAAKIRKKIAVIAEKSAINVQEIQLDCDWTETTRAKYFDLLKKVKNAAPQLPALSATIRLHQVKYFQKTGVPPVDRGMLMFYNMSDVRNNTTQNSILDLSVAEKYLQNFDRYPLPLDIALPIFSWGAVTRYGKLVSLLNGFEVDESNQRNLTKIAENQYKVTQSYYEQSVYLYHDDVIRLESVTNEDLQKAKALLFSKVKNTKLTLSFYDLSERNLQKHNISTLQKILN